MDSLCSVLSSRLMGQAISDLEGSYSKGQNRSDVAHPPFSFIHESWLMQSVMFEKHFGREIQHGSYRLSDSGSTSMTWEENRRDQWLPDDCQFAWLGVGDCGE